MSTYTHRSMTNDHVVGLIGQFLEVMHTWQERQQGRRELLRWNERDMRDAGVSPGDVRFEAAKPFWQA